MLVRPQLAVNIGMCARAMANFGLVDLRLVSPREGWPRTGAYRKGATIEGLDRAAAVEDVLVFHAGTTRAAGRIVTDGGRVLAVVLTGMGQDGTAGCEVIRRAGGQVLAQDEESSVVWGMPRFVITSGLADKVLPLDQMAPEMLRRVMESRGGFRREFERATL